MVVGMLPPIIQEIRVSSTEAIGKWREYAVESTKELTAAAAAAEAEATKMEAAAERAALRAQEVAAKAGLAAEQTAQKVAQTAKFAEDDALAAQHAAEAARAKALELAAAEASTSAEIAAAEDAALRSETAAADARIKADRAQQTAAMETAHASEKASLAAKASTAEAVKTAEAAAGAKATATEAAASAEAGAGRSAVALGGLKSAANTALLGTGVALAGIGYESVKMAGNFQQSTSLLATGAGESRKNIGMVSQGMLDMAGKTGTSAEELSKTMYLVESAGYHGAAGLKVLSAAAQGAKTDGADAADVGNALTTVMTDMHAPASAAADVMSKMVAAVGQGKMRMNDLAGSIHSVLPNASALGLGFDQVGGALATMTAQGMSADQAAQNLNHVIVSLASPTAVMTKTMAAYGLSSLSVSKNLGKNGLSGTLDILYQAVIKQSHGGVALQSAFMANKVAAEGMVTMFSKLPPQVQKLANEMVKGHITSKQFTGALDGQTLAVQTQAQQFIVASKHASGFSQALKSGKGDLQTMTGALAGMTGGQTGLQVAMHLTGENAKTFSANIKKIGSTTADTDGTVKDFKETQKNFNNQLATVKASLGAMAITIGNQLIPPISSLLGFFQKHTTVLKVLVGVVAGIALGLSAYALAVKAAAIAQKVWTGAVWLFNAAMDANPIGLIILAIAALVAGIVYAYTHFSGFRQVVNDVGSALSGAFTDTVNAVVDVWNGMVSAFSATVDWFKSLPGKIMSGLAALPGLLLRAVELYFYLWGYGLGLIVKAAIALPGLIWNGLKALPGLIGGLFTSLWHGVVSIATSMWNGLGVIFTAVYTTLLSWASKAVSGTVKFFSELPGKVVTFVEQLPGKIKGAVSSAGSWLLSAGKQVVQGLINGLKSAAGAAVSAVANIGGNILAGFKNAMGIHSPSQKFAEIARWIPAGIAKGIEQGRQSAIIEMQHLGEQITKTGNAWAEHLVASTGRVLVKLGTKYESLVARMKTAKADLASLVQQSDQLASNTAGQITGMGDVTQVQGANGAGVTSDDIVSSLQASVQSAKDFGNALSELKAQGLDSASLSQLAAAGPQAGLATAQALLAGGKSAIQTVSVLQGQLAQTATATGKQVADAMYGSGISAAQGLVNGLQSQEDKVLAQINKMVTGMVKAVKANLKIKSPSAVFSDEVGAMIPAGIAQGITSNIPLVTSALSQVQPIGTTGGGFGSSGRGGGQQSYTFTIPVEVRLDGKVIATSVQTATLKRNLQNSSNGLTVQVGR